MMTKIYKYTIILAEYQTIQVPKGATILCAQMQNDNLWVWAEVDTNPERETEDRDIYVYGTGHEMYYDIPQRYISTVQDRGFVWHVYEGL